MFGEETLQTHLHIDGVVVGVSPGQVNEVVGVNVVTDWAVLFSGQCAG